MPFYHLSFFFLCLVTIPPCCVLLNCGPTNEIVTTNLKFITDEGFISVGNTSTLNTPDLLSILSTLRYFPDKSAKKYGYMIPVIKGGKYLIRTAYYYGGFGRNEPLVFEQNIDGTKWGIVNMTEDYAKGLTSYYEIVAAAMRKMLSICLARNGKTVSNPFITALELENMEAFVYSSTDFTQYALNIVARHNFGTNNNNISPSNITPSDFWNMPPLKAFEGSNHKKQRKGTSSPAPTTSQTKKTTSARESLPSPFSWRVFSVSVNGKNFFTNLNVTTDGEMIVMTPGADIPIGPVINAGEVFQMLPLGQRTLTRDDSHSLHFFYSYTLIRIIWRQHSSDWSGDPCLPQNNSWTGVTCTPGKLARVVTLNLTNFILAGLLSPSIANLTALLAGGDKPLGPTPEMSTLNELRKMLSPQKLAKLNG
ncbi:hypothetical protein PVL29_003193 [Vitis rotundifolia]|uniref:Malectin-like domain-containing protein n=1 Tax=Vitis rotundifolia TaxID=103349 RepID=A0AA39ACD6_VITRO|nr:hypothetical protein PVL29_003193 [Vitis rotundifolia]